MRFIILCAVMCGCGGVVSGSDEDALIPEVMEETGDDTGAPEIEGETPPDAEVEVVEDDGGEADATPEAEDGGAEADVLPPVIHEFPGPCLLSEGAEGVDPRWPYWTVTSERAHSGTRSLRIDPYPGGVLVDAPLQIDDAGLLPYVIEFWAFFPGDLSPGEMAEVLARGGVVGHLFETGLRYLADGTRVPVWYPRFLDPLAGSWLEGEWMRVDYGVSCITSEIQWTRMYLDGIEVLSYTKRVDTGAGSVCGDAGNFGGVGALFRPLFIDDVCLKAWTPPEEP